MCSMRTLRAVLVLPILVGLLATSARAGTNAGFTASISGPTRVQDAQIGQSIIFSVMVADVVSATKGKIVIAYDPTVVAVVDAPGGVQPGGFFPQPFLVFQEAPIIRDDGLESVSAGGAQLGAATTGQGSGTAFTVSCTIIGEVPDEGSFISVVEIQANLSATDTDQLTFEPGEFGVALTRNLPNTMQNFRIDRRHGAAVMTWSTPFPGVDDVVRYWVAGTTDTLSAENPLRSLATEEALADLAALRDAGLDLRTAGLLAIRRALGREIPDGTLAELRRLREALASRQHAVPLRGLSADTEYGFQARSIALTGEKSPLFSGVFRTRLQPDLRPVVITQLHVQPGDQSALVGWKTNRPADTRVIIEELDEGQTVLDTLLADTTDQDGTRGHVVLVQDLSVGTRYRATVGSRLVDVEALLQEGAMSADDVEASRSRFFHTRTTRPLRFLGQPRSIAGTQRAKIKILLNQPAWIVLEYGPAAAAAGKITAGTQIATSVLYPEKRTSTEPLDKHVFTLTGLEEGTRYRYRITAYLDGTPEWNEGDPLNSEGRITTDPRGDEQWSRDLGFKTSAGTAEPPVITRGPQVSGRGRNVVVKWVTDVPTTGSVFLGTWTSDRITLGTADEWEYADLDEYGKPRVANRHRVTLPALDLATRYGFRIESVAVNGLKVVFDPLASMGAAGKVAKLAQPPGGAGRFTTDTTPDTQWPVLLAGPTISSKTHDTAVIEWTTDEPADSEVRFGTVDLNQQFTATDNDVSHKMVVTNLDPGVTYKYVIGSTDPAGNGATESSQATFTTNPEVDLTPPVITDGPEVIYKNDASATIRWVTDEDATTEAEFGPSEALGIVRNMLETATTHEVTLTNLQAGTQYFAQVSSTDLSGNGPTRSAIISFTTDLAADLTPPVISGVNATPADSSTTITWTTDELANSYVEFGTDSLNLDYNVGDVELMMDHEIVLTNLDPATDYYYKVGSVDRANNPAAESAVTRFTTVAQADTTPPSVPSHLVATISNQQVVLTWDAALELDLNGFNVYRRAGAAPFTKLASGVRSNQYTDLNVVNDSTYEYQVTAIDRQNPPNESDPTAVVSATPTASAAPSAPSELTRTGDDYLRPTFVFANATPYVSDATLTYTIQVSTDPDFSKVTASVAGLAEGAGDAAPGYTSWPIDRSLTENETYYWRVRAVEGNLRGPYATSEQFAARETPALPGDFNKDGKVDFDDFFAFVDVFGKEATGAIAKFDLAPNGKIDFDDFFIFVDNFGRSAPKIWAAPHPVDRNATVSMQAVGGTGAADRGTVKVRIRVDGVRQMRAYGLVVRYDPRSVEWMTASPGPGQLLTSRGADAPLFQVLHQSPGELVIGNGIVQGESVSGNGMLAELEFRVIGSAANTAFELSDALVAGSGQDVRRIAGIQSVTLRPRSFYLGTNYPNPFNPATNIEYGLPVAAPVQLTVFDVLGQEVRTLVKVDSQPAGFYTVHWDGRDRAGLAVSSGLYFYRLQTPRFARTFKMTLIK